MLLGFKSQFVDKIHDKTKGLTLRTQPKRMPKVGETIHMYTALRTNHTKHITSQYTLKAIRYAKVLLSRKWTGETTYESTLSVFVDNKKLSAQLTEKFIVLDGFDNLQAFAAFWFEDKPNMKRRPKKYKDTINTDKVMFVWQELPF